jgi:DNA (cytosine-5)-methyltransferase 1
MKSLELFCGAGGLALGTALAGFQHEAVVELDKDSCDTVRLNKTRGMKPVTDWEVIEADIGRLDYAPFGDRITFLAGGVPCQPFSLGGKHLGHEDERNMFPEFIRALGALKPKAFLVENVKGLLRESFADYFEYIILRLSHPLVAMRKSQMWREHRADLERIHTAGKKTKLDYHVVFQLLNAADYGVPQRRERVFIVGFRADLGISWAFPEQTHNRDALLRSMWIEGDYWERHAIPERDRPKPDKEVIASLKERLFHDPPLSPWRTVRDALAGLPRLKQGQTDPDDPNHFLNPGARSYKGHDGSPLDEPAKTLKAGDHGVPGGENTLAMAAGSIRYFSVRECARLQTFPDDYWFSGAWTEQMRQLGNAVPVKLAEEISEGVHTKLSQSA